MRKLSIFYVLTLLLLLTGCEGTANNNMISDIFIGNEWVMILVSILLIVPAIFAITSERGLHFYARTLRRRGRRWFNSEISEFDLTMAKFSAILAIIIGSLIFFFSSYYLIFY